MTHSHNPHLTLPPLPGPLPAALPDFSPPDPCQAPALRWGIIGAGGIAAVFAHDVRAYSSQQVVAVGARNLARAEAFAHAHALPRAWGSYQELCQDPQVDVVYIATPHSHHLAPALMALQAGKAVLVEKAFTRSAPEARQVFDLAADRGLFVMEAMWTRFLPSTLLAHRIVASAILGQMVCAQADHGQSLLHIERLTNPDLAGGALLDLGVYPISFLHSFLGAPTGIQASGVLGPSGVDVSEAVILSYPSLCAVARANANGLSATGAELCFERGALSWDEQFYRPGPLRLRLPGPTDTQVLTWDGSVPGGFQYEAAEVGRCVTQGRVASDLMPWETTLEVMEIMDEVRRQIGVSYPGE